MLQLHPDTKMCYLGEYHSEIESHQCIVMRTGHGGVRAMTGSCYPNDRASASGPQPALSLMQPMSVEKRSDNGSTLCLV